MHEGELRQRSYAHYSAPLNSKENDQMLFNPQWSPKPDVLSLESLISWLEGQPAKAKYDYTSTNHCLLCQYLKSKGFTDINLGPYEFIHGPFRVHCELPPNWNEIS